MVLEPPTGPLMCLPPAAAAAAVSVSSFCDVGFLSKKDWAPATGSSLIIGPEIDAQEKGNKASWNVSSVGILFCAA